MSRRPLARVPAIPAPLPEPRALQNTCNALKEGLDVLSGQRGKPEDRALTIGDLVELGLVTAEQAAAWARG